MYNWNERNKSVKLVCIEKSKPWKTNKNLELFRIILALPKASRIGLDCDIKGQCGHKPWFLLNSFDDMPSIYSFRKVWNPIVRPATLNCLPKCARYLMSIFVVSILLAPLSPLTKIELSFPSHCPIFLNYTSNKKLPPGSDMNCIHLKCN